jgi:hypothetical protein
MTNNSHKRQKMKSPVDEKTRTTIDQALKDGDFCIITLGKVSRLASRKIMAREEVVRTEWK